MKNILFSLALITALTADDIEIIESIPLDDMSDIHLSPVDGAMVPPTTLVVTPLPVPEQIDTPAPAPLVIETIELDEEPVHNIADNAIVEGLGGLHTKVETKKSYLKGIIDGQQYGEYAIADLVNAKLVKKFYKRRQYNTMWISRTYDINQNLFDMMDMLERVESFGLERERYHFSEVTSILETIKQSVDLPDKDRNLAVTQVDVLLSDAFLTLAKDLREGEISFKKFKHILNQKSEEEEINYKWMAQNRAMNYTTLLEKVAQGTTLEQTLSALPTQNEMLELMIQGYNRYVQIAADGGWKKIGKGKQLKEGVVSKKRVPLLAQRLYISGDLGSYNPNITEVTAEMKEALKHYQKRMGIWPSGVLTDLTRRSLNVPVERRLAKIKLNLERMRWEKSPFGLDYIYVNIPDYKMRFYKDGGKDVEMRVVVGKPANPTPIFDATFAYVVINPTWSVPKSIVNDEMLPRIQEDPEYFSKHKFKLYSGYGATRHEVDPYEVDWWQYDEQSHIPYSFVRDPGAGNPLGLVKFMFPNKYAVYMHDTPEKKLFKNSKRAYSHGCIRLHKPQELLSYVSEYFTNVSYERMQEMEGTGKTQSVVLNQKVPVHVRYYTSWVEDDGSVNFRTDIYGYDVVASKLLEK